MINDQNLYFVFNGKKSSDFNVWCSGDGLYDLPDRDVDYITVPGRNGDLVVDNGRWKNVSVTYSCFIPKNFRENYINLIAWLASQKGYGRLEDARHPEYYWLGRVDSDISPKIAIADNSATFTITFNCKPQRFLKSGEETIDVPCDPAASPASARRYWRLSQFPTGTQSIINLELGNLGYTQAEINAMQFSFIELFDWPRDWPLDVAPSGQLKFYGYDADNFFALAFYGDSPMETDRTGSYSVFTETEIRLINYYVAKYYIVPKTFGGEIYYANTKVGQDETYQFGTVINPTRFDAVPRFRLTLPSSLSGLAGATVYMAGAGQNGIAIKWDSSLEALAGCTITFDAETMDAYVLPADNASGQGYFVNLNKNVKIYGNRAILAPGENTIRLDPMVAGCEIIPRWWTT